MEKKTSRFQLSKSHRDSYRKHGYEYNGNILKNVLSKEIFSNPTQYPFLKGIELLIEDLIKSVKYIKLQNSFAHDKDDTERIF